MVVALSLYLHWADLGVGSWARKDMPLSELCYTGMRAVGFVVAKDAL